jgi:hypothetical protein
MRAEPAAATAAVVMKFRREKLNGEPILNLLKHKPLVDIVYTTPMSLMEQAVRHLSRCKLYCAQQNWKLNA